MDLKPLILLACSARNRGPYGPHYANNVSMASLQDELPSRSPNFQQHWDASAWGSPTNRAAKIASNAHQIALVAWFVTTANTTTVRDCPRCRYSCTRRSRSLTRLVCRVDKRGIDEMQKHGAAPSRGAVSSSKARSRSAMA
jgi:hypothetical protein